MGGGLMQLVAYGAQDIYLTGNPQITFFKVVYRRHTNFSMETIAQTINGSAKGDGSKGTVTISRNGDLVHKVYVVVNEDTTITEGDKIVKEVKIEIGGQEIDKHTSEWMQVWNELTTPESKAIGLKSMTGCIGTSGSTGVNNVIVPLQFWFCRNPGLALPLIALQYHEVKLQFTWGAPSNGSAAAKDAEVHCDYIYLDTDERRRFAQVSHEYLIEQLQIDNVTDSASIKLNLNHPVKELIWTSTGGAASERTKLVLNGHDRFAEQSNEYFQLRQPVDHHTAVPRQNLPSGARSSLVSHTTTVTAITSLTNIQLVNQSDDAVDANNDFHYTASTRTLKVRVAGNPAEIAAGTVLLFSYDDAGSTANSPGTYIATVKTAVDLAAGTAGDIVFTGLPVLMGDNKTTLAVDSDDGDHIVLIGSLSGLSNEARTSKLTNKINVYSFALEPEEHQPSGTCNFSRIDNAHIKRSNSSATIVNLYAVNYNVLRIMSGMGGLAYSN